LFLVSRVCVFFGGISRIARPALIEYSVAEFASRFVRKGSTMAADTSVRPFRIDFPEDALDDMRRRISATRWPERETVTNDSQGVPLATMQELAHHWSEK
jgi:Epoxide hydrolase N terminus